MGNGREATISENKEAAVQILCTINIQRQYRAAHLCKTMEARHRHVGATILLCPAWIASFVVYGKIEVVRSEVMGETFFSSRQYGRQCLMLLPDDVMCRDESKREIAGCVCLMKEDLCARHLISSDSNDDHSGTYICNRTCLRFAPYFISN